MAVARYNPSYPGVGKMLTSGFMRRAMAARAKKVRTAFVAIAAIDTGEWKSSVTVETEIKKDLTGPGSRVVARVVSNDPAGLSKETGHIAHRTGIGPPRFVPGDHAMTRSLPAAGGV